MQDEMRFSRHFWGTCGVRTSLITGFLRSYIAHRDLGANAAMGEVCPSLNLGFTEMHEGSPGIISPARGSNRV